MQVATQGSQQWSSYMVHISNLHLNLVPIVKLAATHFGKHAWRVISPADDSKRIGRAEWVLVSSRAHDLNGDAVTALASDSVAASAIEPWTDDYSSIRHPEIVARRFTVAPPTTG
jgi:hypothetical protein